MEYILAMTFTTEGGKNTTLSINGVKSDITPADANNLMDLIISKNIFLVDAGALIGKDSAKFTERKVTKFDVA